MERDQVERIVTEYLPKLYGFALRRTANAEDANDLTQEILMKLYRALLVSEIEQVNAFVWRVAYNTLANYYRGKTRSGIGVFIENFEEVACEDQDLAERMVEEESIRKLQTEIAYLSKIQREIVVLYYYDGKKQEEIAKILSVPVGTVKWHLFEARREMKKGMETMRATSELKFNPVRFCEVGFSGSLGTMGRAWNFFRSSLSQNIAYCVYHEAKTVNEIAECLGVSPVYIESEVDFLEEYGFLIKKGEKYLTYMLIDEADEELKEIIALQEEIYTKASKWIGDELFDKLMKSGLLDSEQISYPDGDKNFLMWGIILYLLAWSKDERNPKIRFEEVSTLRRDGGENIAIAGIEEVGMPKLKYYDSMKNWCGPLWNERDNHGEKLLLWQINSEWSDRENLMDDYQKEAERDLNLLQRFLVGEVLSKDEYAQLVRKGYLRGVDGGFELAVILLKGKKIV